MFLLLRHGFDIRIEWKKRKINETYTVFEFLCIHRYFELRRRYGIYHYTYCSNVGARHTLRVDIDFSGGILSMGVANVASSSDSMKPTFQHYHGDGTSFLRGPAPPPVVRNSSVVLIMLISFFLLFYIYCLFYRRGQRSTRLEELLSFSRSLANGLAVNVTEKQYRRTYQNIFVLSFVYRVTYRSLTFSQR